MSALLFICTFRWLLAILKEIGHPKHSVDRLEIRLMSKLLGKMPHDPELDHPEAE